MAVFTISRWENGFDADAFTRATGVRPRRTRLQPEQAPAQAPATPSNLCN
jgi:aerobic C4-dicarboxylate transport protein